MPRTGATYTRPSNSFTQPVSGTPVSSSDADTYFDDLDTALTESATYASPTFTGTVDVSQAFKVSGVISPAQITANQDNYNPTGLSTATVLRLSSDAARDVTGLAGGAAGRLIAIQNVGGFAITLKDASGSSDAANQFALSGDLVLAVDSVALLFYDGTSTKWRSLNDSATADPQTLMSDTTATLTAGFKTTSVSLGTITGANQTITPNEASGQHQHCTLNGSSLTGTLTVNPPAASTQVVLEVTNGGSGAVGATLSVGTTKTDGTWVTTNASKFLFILTKTQTYSHCQIVPLQ